MGKCVYKDGGGSIIGHTMLKRMLVNFSCLLLFDLKFFALYHFLRVNT